jgi:ATP-dependent Clp protease ATP-binding subunit ClpA
LIALAFGVADWNTLSAMIRERRPVVGHISRPPEEALPVFPFSGGFAAAMRRAIDYANQRHHEYATLEHLSLALSDDPDASGVVMACNADLAVLKRKLADYIDDDLKRLVVSNREEAKPSAAFHRVVQRAALQAQGLNRSMVTGANVLVAIFAETASPAARLLTECGVSREDATSFVIRD